MASLKRRVETTPIVVSLPNCPIRSILFQGRALRQRNMNPSSSHCWANRTPLSFSCILAESIDVVIHYSTGTTIGVLIFGVYCPPVKRLFAPPPPLDNAGIPRYNSNHHEHTILCASQIPKTWQPKSPRSQDQKASPYMGGVAAHCPIYS